ncbi:MAG TPA: vanadium-dependent haloperoxidase [Puia sp.]|nr:vanadium-dependent haloperoxidase [Puia sp.]
MKPAFNLFFFIFFVGILEAQPEDSPPWIQGKAQEQVFAITQVMFHDVIDPPAAARFYAYSTLTGYEILSLQNKTLPRIQENFIQYPAIKPTEPHRVNARFSALYGILETAGELLPSGYLLEEKKLTLYQEFASHHISTAVLDSSVIFAKSVSRIIVQYARQDGYFHLSVFERYRPLKGDSVWQPTPPDYMAAVQPHWSSMRAFFMDSAAQFKPLPLTRFSKDKNSAFYQMADQVYKTGKNLSPEEKLMANYWDCNPFAVQFEGHMSVGLKKISPGGHWMGIAGTACLQKKLGFENTVLLITALALSLHDAFISCWDEKYRSNRIRPETYINRYIDEKWVPLLQTPPFPEYTSGHSVISTTAALILTHYLGENFSFRDTTETYIGLPARKFESFIQASEEACISRLYGGIHFLDAIENGKEEGRRIAEYILPRLPKRLLKQKELNIE